MHPVNKFYILKMFHFNQERCLLHSSNNIVTTYAYCALLMNNPDKPTKRRSQSR